MTRTTNTNTNALPTAIGAGLLTLLAAPAAIAGSFEELRPSPATICISAPRTRPGSALLGRAIWFNTSATFAMGCLNDDGSARWILQSSSDGSGETGPAAISDYIQPDYNAALGTYTRSLTDVRIGRNCELQATLQRTVELRGRRCL